MQCGLDELNPSARSIQMDMNNRKNEVNIEKKKRSIAIEVGASHALSTAISPGSDVSTGTASQGNRACIGP